MLETRSKKGTGGLLPRIGTGDRTLEGVLAARCSVRKFSGQPLALEAVAHLLWAAQGTRPDGQGRTAPSAGALYPLEVSLVAGEVASLAPGVYRYRPVDHRLDRLVDSDPRRALRRAALDQRWVEAAPAVVVLSAVYRRTTAEYGARGRRYVHMEAGHAAQNVCLEATRLGLGTVVVGAFEDDDVRRILGLGVAEEPLCLMPVGRPARA